MARHYTLDYGLGGDPRSCVLRLMEDRRVVECREFGPGEREEALRVGRHWSRPFVPMEEVPAAPAPPDELGVVHSAGGVDLCCSAGLVVLRCGDSLVHLLSTDFESLVAAYEFKCLRLTREPVLMTVGAPS